MAQTQVNVKITESLIRRAKLDAVKCNTPLQEWMEQAVVAFLKLSHAERSKAMREPKRMGRKLSV